MKPTLYGAPLSPFVRKARIVLAEKGIDYDLVPLDPFRKSEELLRLSPLGRVPALVDDGKTLADSGVIAQYLEKKWPTPPLKNVSTYERPLAYVRLIQVGAPA